MSTIAADHAPAASPATTNDVVQVRRRTIDTVLVGAGALMTVVFLVAGALLMWGSNFADDYVGRELGSQNITFADEAALVDEGRTDLVKYAGEQVTTGQEAEAYASYIDGHLDGIADGATYADLGGPEREARTALQTAKDDGADEATVAELQATYDEVSGQRNTPLQGRDAAGPAADQLRLGHGRDHRRLRRLRRLRRRRPDGGAGDARTAPPSPAGHGIAGRRDLITVRRPTVARRLRVTRGRRARVRGRAGRRGRVG